MTTRSKKGSIAVLLAALGAAPSARADLLDDVSKQVSTVHARRLAAQVQAEKAATHEEKKAEDALKKAEERLKKAQAALDAAQQNKAAVEKDRTASEKQKADATAKRKAAPLVAEASKALAASVAALQGGHHDIKIDAEKVAKDPELALAAKALAGMAAALKGDDKAALAELSPEVTAQFPSAKRWTGLAKLHVGDAEGAWKDLSSAQLATSDGVAQRALGELAAKRNDQKAAAAAFGAAYATDPTDAAAALGLVNALLALGRDAETVAPLTLLASLPGQKQANYLLARVSEQGGDRMRAEAALANMFGAEAPGARSDSSYLRVNRPMRLLPTHEVWTKLAPAIDDAAARTRLAWFRLQRGYPEAALAALEQSGDRADALYVRGLADLRLGRYADARAAFEKAAGLDPKRSEPVEALGVAWLESGDAPKAREVLASVVGSDDLAQVADAMAQVELGKTKDAEAALAKTTRAPGALGEAAATDLAMLKRKAGACDQALRVLPEKPRTPEGWLLRGLCLADQKDARAVAALKGAIDLAPNYVDAWLALSRALVTRDPDGAMAAAHRALDFQPGLVEAHATLATIYGKKGDTAKQAAELAKIREVGEKVKDAAGKRHTVAVVAFDNNSGDKSLDWLRQGVAEALVTDLGHLGGLQLIERTQVQKGFQEMKLQELGIADPSAAAKVAKMVGADALLLGQFVRDGDGTVRLDGRVVEVGSAKILKTGSATGKLDQIFDVERRLALDLLQEYAAVTDHEKQDFFGAKQPSMAALNNMSRIRMLSAEGKMKEAKAAYEKLLAEDPAAAEKLKDLQKQWADLAATVAVAPLKNISGRPDEGWVGVGLSEALATDLKRVGLYLVERQQLEWLMQERRLTEISNEADAVKLGKLAGASFLVIGSYQSQSGELRIDARLVEVSSSQVLATWSVNGHTNKLFEAEAQLAKDVAQALKVEPSAVEKAALAASKPSLDDFKRYIQASSKLVVKDAPTKEIAVNTLAIGAFKDATGAVDPVTTATVKRTLERDGRVPVRVAESPDPKNAPADALVLGTVTRAGDKVRIDARAIATSSGEVVASATAVASLIDADASREQVADTLLSSLGLRRSGSDKSPSKKHVPLSTWLPWTIAGIIVVGAGATVGGIFGAQAAQHTPAADASINVH
jgi:TolB-like protein